MAIASALTDDRMKNGKVDILSRLKLIWIFWQKDASKNNFRKDE
jgi:hypothetical protein